MLDTKTTTEALARLKRIEGQVRGIARMVEDTEYCIDIINQITAERRALEKVDMIVMQRHMASCLAEAINKHQETPKIREFMETLDQFIR